MSLGLELLYSEAGITFHLGKWFIPLPIKPWRDLRDICESWGIKYADNALFLSWGTKFDPKYPSQGKSRTKLFWMPWDYGANIRYEVQAADGSFVKAAKWNETDDRKTYIEKYTYILNSGEKQHVTANFHVEEREWRWRITHKLPFKFGPKRVQRCIDVKFSSEIGERTGSWKGGCIGCGYQMLKTETPLETLRRMEQERKFK